MGFEEAKEPRALRYMRESATIVAREPTIKHPVPHAFERMQQPQGDYLAGPEVGLGVFGDVVQLLIDVVEQSDDQIPCGHAALLSGADVMLTSMEESDAYSKSKGLYC
jgi:hypothetical protein